MGSNARAILADPNQIQPATFKVLLSIPFPLHAAPNPSCWDEKPLGFECSCGGAFLEREGTGSSGIRRWCSWRMWIRMGILLQLCHCFALSCWGIPSQTHCSFHSLTVLDVWDVRVRTGAWFVGVCTDTDRGSSVKLNWYLSALVTLDWTVASAGWADESEILPGMAISSFSTASSTWNNGWSEHAESSLCPWPVCDGQLAGMKAGSKSLLCSSASCFFALRFVLLNLCACFQAAQPQHL